MSNNLIELRLKREALHKRLDLVNHQIDVEIESQLDKQSNNSPDGMFLTNEQLHKLLSYLEHTIISDEDISKLDKDKLVDFRDELSWDIADCFSYNLNEGTVEPNDFKFKLFTFDE